MVNSIQTLLRVCDTKTHKTNIEKETYSILKDNQRNCDKVKKQMKKKKNKNTLPFYLYLVSHCFIFRLGFRMSFALKKVEKNIMFSQVKKKQSKTKLRERERDSNGFSIVFFLIGFFRRHILCLISLIISFESNIAINLLLLLTVKKCRCIPINVYFSFQKQVAF